MRINLLRNDLQKYLKRHGLVKVWDKQKTLFEENFRYPSLHTERLEPKHLRIYSFRLDRKYRAIFIFNPDLIPTHMGNFQFFG